MRTRYPATIGFRILVAFCCLFVLVIIQGTLAFYSSHQVVATQRQALTNQLTLLAFREKLSHVRIKMFMLLGTLNPTTMETLKTEIEAILNDLMEESTALQVPSETLAKSQQTYQDIMALHWEFRTTQAYELINSTSVEEYETLYGTLATLSSSIDTAMQETVRQSNRQFVVVTIGLCGVGLLIVIVWGWYLNRSIAGPIKQAVQAAQRIADGDLSLTLDVRRNDETGQLLTAFNAMSARLKALLVEVETLMQAVQVGQLDRRGDAQAFAGGWRDLIQGINTVVDAFVAPITMTAQYIARIATGEIPDTITETYQGDFNTIKDHLNMLIAATQDITQVAQALAAGNLEVDVQERSAQDTLMQALNTMIHRLRAVVQQVKAAAQTVAVGSSEMRLSAGQMSQGATEQATATEEASSSLEEMAANIRQNAENAAQTEQMAKRAVEDAEEGGQAVIQTVAAMKEIVAKIVIVQEIAQETRMLSLNATIEAARASEPGKAFATVAAEIRQLADTAKTAAEAIRQVSDSSVAIAERSGELLATIVPNSQKTAELVQEISATSSEQSTGVNQVNRAMQQLDQVTQQNASLAEEVASMAEELEAQATQLQKAVAFFTLGEAAGPEEAVGAACGATSGVVDWDVSDAWRGPSPRQGRASGQPVAQRDSKQGRTSPRDPEMNQMKREAVDAQKAVSDPHDADFERY